MKKRLTEEQIIGMSISSPTVQKLLSDMIWDLSIGDYYDWRY